MSIRFPTRSLRLFISNHTRAINAISLFHRNTFAQCFSLEFLWDRTYSSKHSIYWNYSPAERETGYCFHPVYGVTLPDIVPDLYVRFESRNTRSYCVRPRTLYTMYICEKFHNVDGKYDIPTPIMRAPAEVSSLPSRFLGKSCPLRRFVVSGAIHHVHNGMYTTIQPVKPAGIKLRTVNADDNNVMGQMETRAPL